ncbi:hypothetical protein Q9295_01460 [Xinfangfangia sp. CPCC 101601]|uniref:Major facilitator superfamily (MFS) profile domain-containing protein n=1 Tax=Pseudogemmobacter lacusdianii TaxID=3069608 RepID=A0ABU0VTG7_9RHOB|nr:hypothetical protein [Xinfangfangia sp. CPCC 101601]MDQ2065026.1 hypothetical protein [Xinfangfangia sp. CPCC 101601]
MEFALVLAVLAVISVVAGVGAFVGWRRGRRRLVLAVIGVIVIAAAIFAYLASIATGHYLSGLLETLIALALLVGPGAAMVIGIVSALNRWAGLALFALYGLGLFSTIVVI